MGDFDFLGDAGSSKTVASRTVVRRQKPSNGYMRVVQIAIGVIVAVCLTFGGCVFLTGVGMYAVNERVVDDAIEQYNIVVQSNGSEIEKHVHAGLVAEACLQARDKDGYNKWKRIRDIHARNAGLPKLP